jgi:hypothetical protein
MLPHPNVLKAVNLESELLTISKEFRQLGCFEALHAPPRLYWFSTLIAIARLRPEELFRAYTLHNPILPSAIRQTYSRSTKESAS